VLPDLLDAAPGHRTAAAAANSRRRRPCSAEEPPQAAPRPTKATNRFLSPPLCFSPCSPSPPAAPGAEIRPPAAPLLQLRPGVFPREENFFQGPLRKKFFLFLLFPKTANFENF